MNIGLFYNYPVFPPKSGASVHGYQLFRQLARRGHKIFTWATYHGEHPDIAHFRRRQLPSFLTKIDVLYVRTEWSHAKLRWTLVKYLAGFKKVVWELNGHPNETAYSGTQKDLATVVGRMRLYSRHVDGLIGVTEELADFGRTDLGIPRVRCIPNGSDPELFADRTADGPPAGPFTVVWVGGSGAAWHDLNAMIQAAKILLDRGRDIHILFVGGFDKVAGQLPENVRVSGHVDYHRLGELLRTADVGVHFVRSDGTRVSPYFSPLKAFDYMACGLAVIGQEGSQLERVIREEDCGVVIDTGATELAEAIESLADDRDRCRRMGANSRKAVERYYNWERVAAETEGFLEEVMGRR